MMTPDALLTEVQVLRHRGALTDDQALCIFSAPYNTDAEKRRLERLVLELALRNRAADGSPS